MWIIPAYDDTRREYDTHAVAREVAFLPSLEIRPIDRPIERPGPTSQPADGEFLQRTNTQSREQVKRMYVTI